ncbi:unnamed protein product [Discosporangium mesarthrocarpum]
MSVDLVRNLWPMLEAVPRRLGWSTEILGQLFMLLSKMLTSLRGILAQQIHIPTMLEMIVTSYNERQHPCCLDCMATAVEVYGQAPEAQGPFGTLLSRASTQTFSVMTAAASPAEVPQLSKAYFELLFRFLLFCPSALVGSQAVLHSSLHLAHACIGTPGGPERESARAVLSFVSQLAGRCGGQLDRFRAEIDGELRVHGEGLTRLFFEALAGSSPPVLWPNLIDALYALLRAFAEPQHQGIVQKWVFNALQGNSVCPGLGDEDRKHVMDAVLRLLAESRQRFKALMLDFAKICHNEMTKDGLLAYYL